MKNFYFISMIFAVGYSFLLGYPQAEARQTQCDQFLSFEKEVDRTGSHRRPRSVILSPHAQYMAVAYENDLIIVDIVHKKLMTTYPISSWNYGDPPIKFFADDLFFIRGQSFVGVVGIENSQAVVKLNFHSQNLANYKVAKSPDDKFFALLRDDQIDIFELPGLKLVNSTGQLKEYIHDVKFSLDSKFLVTTYDNYSRGKTGFSIIDLSTFQKKIYDQDNDKAYDINFDPTGRWMSVGSAQFYDLLKPEVPVKIVTGVSLPILNASDLIGPLANGHILIFGHLYPSDSVGSFFETDLNHMSGAAIHAFPHDGMPSLFHDLDQSGILSPLSFWYMYKDYNDQFHTYSGHLRNGKLKIYTNLSEYRWVASDRPNYLYHYQVAPDGKFSLSIFNTEGNSLSEIKVDDDYSLVEKSGTIFVATNAPVKDSDQFSFYQCRVH